LGSSSGQTPGSPGGATGSGGCKLQCKKCGILTTNESELQEHIANVHGESPYGSSGYASSPYIKEEMPTPQPPGVGGSTAANPGELLDLDSQKMVYHQQLLQQQQQQQQQQQLTLECYVAATPVSGIPEFRNWHLDTLMAPRSNLYPLVH